jgi:hypothetical protein
MAHTPWLAPLQSDNLHLGQLYLLLPQSYPLHTPIPHPGQIYVTVNTNSILPSPPHLPPVLHPGPSYPIASFQPCKIARMPNIKSRQSLGVLWTRFPFNYLLSLTIIIQIRAHYYTHTSPYHRYNSHSVILSTYTLFISVSSLVV